MEVVIWILIVIAVVFYIFRRSGVRHAGQIITKSGGQYSFEAGNDIWLAGNGLQVNIKKTLPHMYLDSHGDSKTQGPMRTYHNSQKISLEGDFDKHFQLFAPKSYQHLVLSILTPDVMHTLIDSNNRYDVEFVGQYMRIMSNRKFLRGFRELPELQKIAEQLLEELEHKYKSWPKDNELQASQATLTSKNEQAVKIFGMYYGIVRVATVAAIVLASVFYLLAWMYWNNEAAEPFMLLALGVLSFPGVPVIFLYTGYRYK